MRHLPIRKAASKVHCGLMASERVRPLNQAPGRADGKHVLYWIQANRRVEYNHALIYAAELANSVNLPLLCYEELDCGQPYASDRFHIFHLEGVEELAAALKSLGAGYCFYLRRKRSDPETFLPLAAEDAAAVVTDDHPTLMQERPVAVHCVAVDSSCIVPVSCIPDKAYAAYSIRPKIKRLLPSFLKAPRMPVLRRRYAGKAPPWHTAVKNKEIGALVRDCEIDHSVAASLTFRGGRRQAEKHLRRFLEERLRLYAGLKNEPSAHATSELSSYLHWGWISPLEIALEVQQAAASGKYVAEEFLEELIVRRELAFNFARYAERPKSLDSLPQWAQETLRQHARDPRPYLYTREQFCAAETHDPLWNATQKEMRLRGKIHGYYRMYWGKKVIEWSRTPEEALETMIEIHDRWALDGRDPNTYANILWCFGLHDRPWPERPVFGKVRTMTLEGMRRKTQVDRYVAEIAELERTGRDPFRIQ